MSDLHPDARFEQARARFLEGLRCFQERRFGDAQQHYLASLELLPMRASTLINLAATQLQLALPDKALASANQALAVDPRAADAWLHRASAFEQLGRLDEALADYGRFLATNDTQPEAWLRHARVLERLGRLKEALASYDRVLALDIAHAQAWSARGGLLREMNRPGDAAHAFRQALHHGADPDLHAYYLASVDPAQRMPPTAPRAYVQALFDDYADEFDTHLVNQLHYQAHRHLVDGLVALGRGPYEHALDLGCGTGLCGPLVRPHARRLTGLDLSPRMLEAARALGVYDRLEQAELVEHLLGTAEPHDLVLACDVFIYVGDLAPVFAAVRRVMPRGVGRGIFCFSVEAAEGARGDFELHHHLRYAHSQGYLRRLAAEHGFEVLGMHQGMVRRDQRQPIDGLFVYLG